ncbi:MAG: tRNA pseudouridine(55) synthase TruB [Pirellulales bacterium]
MEPFGLLNINKPSGMTSRRVVDVVQRLVRPAKAGHAGTLDPLASGVLVVCLGAATRLIEYVQRMPKRYTGTFLLGRESPTEDVEGPVTELPDAPRPTLDELARAATELTGPIQQRPPAFSALKVAGRRAYDLARAGKDVVLQPRPVMVHRLAVARYEYPEMTLDVECGAGTYIRSLGRDLANRVGTAAVMSALTRTAIGSFRLAEACELDRLTPQTLAERVLPALRAVESLPTVVLTDEESARIKHGLAVEKAAPPGEEFAGVDCSGRLVAILVRRADGCLGPLRNFG